MAMPSIFALMGYNGSYVQFLAEEGDMHRLLQSSASDVVSPFTRFKLVESGLADGTVSILCRYNNKYLMTASAANHSIIAGATEPDTDTSSWSCTLFEPSYDSDTKVLYLKHTHSNYYVYPAGDNYLVASSAGQHTESAFQVIDAESLVVLPKYMTLLSQALTATLYLKFFWVDEDNKYLIFNDAYLGSQYVPQDSFQVGDGTLQFRSVHLGYYWLTADADAWVNATGTDSTPVPANLFRPIKVDDTTLALYSLFKEKYLQLYPDGILPNCLAAAADSVDEYSKFTVVEAVAARTIADIQYNVQDSAVIKEEQSVVVLVSSVTNNTSEEATMDVTFHYDDIVSATFTNSLTFKSNVESEFQTVIPLIGEDGTVTVSSDMGGTFSFGSTTNVSKTADPTQYTATVPAMTQMTVKLLATKGTCSVPFSYTQKDTFSDDTVKSYDMVDGVYTGINFYNYHFDTEEAPVST